MHILLTLHYSLFTNHYSLIPSFHCVAVSAFLGSFVPGPYS